VAEALTLPLAAPVPPEYAGRFDRLPRSTYGRHQVFTGPYRIAGGGAGLLPAADAPRIMLERNPGWDSGEELLDRLRGKVLQLNPVRLRILRDGARREVDRDTQRISRGEQPLDREPRRDVGVKGH
jgi:hypothetical protein